MLKKYNLSVNPWQDITSLGSMTLYGVLLLLILTVKKFDIFLSLLVGFIFAYSICIVVRLVYFRNRPKKRNHKNLLEKLDAASFPSIHAARITFLVFFFSVYFATFWSTIALVSVGMVVLFSRYKLQMHDWKDLLAGVVVGCITYYIVLLLF